MFFAAQGLPFGRLFLRRGETRRFVGSIGRRNRMVIKENAPEVSGKKAEKKTK